MGVQAFLDGRCYLDSIDLSGHSNEAAVVVDGAVLERTPIKGEWVRRRMGRKSAAARVAGAWEAGTGYPDEAFTLLGSQDKPVTLAADGDAGGIAYVFGGVTANYSVGGSGGDWVQFTVDVPLCTTKVARGMIVVDDTAARTATANGSAFQVGAVSSVQTLYAALHVFAASGTSPTLDVKIQSDNADTMSSPTDRITFSQMTTVGSQLSTLAGAITDDYYRAVLTIGGTSPSFTVAVVVGIA